MGFQDDQHVIRWHIHLASPPDEVHRMLATDEGRARFWAESAIATEGGILFRFPDASGWQGNVVANQPADRFSVRYFGDSTTTFELVDDGAGGTDLTLTDVGVPAADRAEVVAGWVSVLLALKAAVDFGVDLRNHDPQRTWAQGYADN